MLLFRISKLRILRATGFKTCINKLRCKQQKLYTIKRNFSQTNNTFKTFHSIPKGQKQVSMWLFFCSGMVFSMVVLGGVTRLTRSGLSMTSWSFLGSIFPRTEEEWQEEFDRYKKFPEYQKMTSMLTLSEFKRIYFMEYAHRMFGRALGIAFALPLAYFSARGYINKSLFKRLSLLMGLGASQAVIGWWMVKSGLEDKPSTHMDLSRVSPYRLAVHLVSAFGIYILLLKTAFGCFDSHLISQKRFKSFVAPQRRLRGISILSSSVILLTVLSGVFVAGNDAGSIYNTFPWMGENGRIVPSDYLDENLKPFSLNFLENQANVQFNHRVMGTSTFLVCLGVFLMSRGRKTPGLVKTLSSVLLGAAFCQAGLGITTLVCAVPVPLGAMHQGGALSLVTVAFLLLHILGPRRYILFLKAALK